MAWISAADADCMERVENNRASLPWLQAHQALSRGFNVELTASTEAYLKAARAHGDPGRLTSFFQKLMRGAAPETACGMHALPAAVCC